MGIKKSVFLSNSTEQWIADTTIKNEKNPLWSESINVTFAQFRLLLKNSLPELTNDEWMMIINIYKECYMPGHALPARIASDIMIFFGAVDVNTLSDDCRDIVIKLNTMSQAEQLAILYVVQIYWANKWTEDFNETLRFIKLIF